MYDVCSLESFKHATEQLYPLCKQDAVLDEKQFVMLVGNKMDVPEDQRQVDFDTAFDFA